MRPGFLAKVVCEPVFLAAELDGRSVLVVLNDELQILPVIKVPGLNSGLLLSGWWQNSLHEQS